MVIDSNLKKLSLGYELEFKFFVCGQITKSETCKIENHTQKKRKLLKGLSGASSTLSVVRLSFLCLLKDLRYFYSCYLFISKI